MIAALFIQPDGCYSEVSDLELWGELRDARTYAGPHPVVAHPPCQQWGKFARVNFKRWGGEHNKPGNDGGCFLSALNSVRMFGGVLEHPAQSYAFSEYGLPKPLIEWTKTTCGGWVCEVWQSAYGHKANKATWLYYVGENLPPQMNWSRPIGTHQVGFQDQRGKAMNKPTLSKKEANATPLAFRDALIDMVRNSGGMPCTK